METTEKTPNIFKLFYDQYDKKKEGEHYFDVCHRNPSDFKSFWKSQNPSSFDKWTKTVLLHFIYSDPSCPMSLEFLKNFKIQSESFSGLSNHKHEAGAYCFDNLDAFDEFRRNWKEDDTDNES